MSNTSSPESVASTVVASKKNACHQISSKPTKVDLNRIKKDLQNHTERLQWNGRHIFYSWEDNFNRFEIKDYMKRLERQVDELDFQVERNIELNAKFFSKIAKVIEDKYLPETI